MVPGLSGAIIAAGRGERLRGASGGMPKPLVEVGGEALLVRQARMLIALGARPVHAIINSETAAMIRALKLVMPPELEIFVRDTGNSLESLLALGERLESERFLMTTVDAIIAPTEMAGFLKRALEITDPSFAEAPDGALGVVRWRGDRHPLFAEVASDGVISRLGGAEAPLVTAGVYLFSTRIFALRDKARSAGLDALRRYLAFLISEGMRFAGIELADAIDVDEAADLHAARALLANEGGRL